MSGNATSLSEDLATGYLRLRILVGFGGERCEPRWWRSTISSPVGQRFIRERLFPRTGDSATVESLVRVAQQHHDRLIPGGGAFHLFRLPLPIESAMHAEAPRNRAGSELPLSGDVTSLLESLSDEARARLQDSTIGGPVSCGPEALLWSPETVGLIAGLYLAAFRTGTQTVPYFVESGA